MFVGFKHHSYSPEPLALFNVQLSVVFEVYESPSPFSSNPHPIPTLAKNMSGLRGMTHLLSDLTCECTLQSNIKLKQPRYSFIELELLTIQYFPIQHSRYLINDMTISPLFYPSISFTVLLQLRNYFQFLITFLLYSFYQFHITIQLLIMNQGI